MYASRNLSFLCSVSLLRMVLFYLLLVVILPASAVTLEQIVSHEHPLFQILRARMTVGRDGLVYIGNGGGGMGYLLRLKADGSEKTGATINYATSALAANADGILANSAGHFSHAVIFYNDKLQQYTANNDFLVSDIVSWDAPIWMEVGASGNFYAADQHRNRIVRLDAAGKILSSYPMVTDKDESWNHVVQFRVTETGQALLWLTNGQLRLVGLDGKIKWVQESGIVGNAWSGLNGSFDIDDSGTIYLLPHDSNQLKKISLDGKPSGAITLQMGAITPGIYPVTDVRIYEKKVFIKRRHPTELFQVFDLNTGVRQTVVEIDYERLRVEYPSELWTAGNEIPFSLAFTGNGKVSSPKWRIWARPYGGINYRQLREQDGKLQVPGDFAGLYLLKVTPETEPWQRGQASEYMVHGVVEVRKPDTQGVATVLASSHRVNFARGEDIPLTVYLQCRQAPPLVTVSLLEGGKPISAGNYPVPAGEKKLQLLLSGKLTLALRSGIYQLSVQAEGLTGMSQQIYLGAGIGENPFKLVQYGDYTPMYPQPAEVWNSTEEIASHLERSKKLGFNLFVDRIGHPFQINDVYWTGQASIEMNDLLKRLEADPLGVTPEVARVPSPLLQTLSAYSAHGMAEMSILMGNDAGLPLGSGYDNRKPEILTADLQKISSFLLPFPAFRGWSWSSNWWVFDKNSVLADKRTVYETALIKAQQTGEWDNMLDDGSDRWLMLSYDAHELFNNALRQISPRLLTASAAPYRNLNVHPPIGLSNVDEVDLQIQWEQMAPPWHAPHNVDYYSRPGKPAWGHPEIWNDSGTGDQILPTLFAMVMRGASGVGQSGKVPNWGTQAEDARVTHHGLPSIFRTLNASLSQYGPWLTSLKGNDQVAILISGRMARTDDWTLTVWGRYFARTLEAYVACLHAHHPAAVIFAEDIRPTTLANYKALLIVGQRVALEPGLLNALRRAEDNGSTVFYDDTCRKELVAEFTPLGVGFNRFESDLHAAGDDAAYWRFYEYIRATLPVVKTKLDEVVAPVAQIDNPEVLISERVAGDGRFLFVVNNTTPQIDPGQMWRATLCVASRMPVVESIQLSANRKVIYDLFAMKKVAAQDGKLQADLRTLPMRIYVLLPKAIGKLELIGPRKTSNGETLAYQLRVLDDAGAVVRTTIPLRLRLLDEQGEKLEEKYDYCSVDGLGGEFAVPWNVSGKTLTLEASELFSGITTRLSIPLTVMAAPALNAPPSVRTMTPPTAQGAAFPIAKLSSVEDLYGPHLRDIAIIDNGKIAIINAMNWDQNLYGVDLATGELRWRDRVGHHFSYAPQMVDSGFTVQGYDMLSAEGYHLYLGDNQGKLLRRFALYGISRRTPQRFVPGLLNDRLNNFAVPSSAEWVAASGDLGIAVWSRDGKLLWSEDSWKSNRNYSRWEGMGRWWSARLVAPSISAIDNKTLVVSDGLTAIAYNAQTKQVNWQVTLATGGEVRQIIPWQNGKGCAILSTVQGGRLFFIQDGKLVDTITTAADAVVLSPDGKFAVATVSNQLQCYEVGKGMQWNTQGDDVLRSPRYSADGNRISVCSEIGTLYVFDKAGKMLYQHDEATLPVAAWLPNGDLLVATWMGKLKRLDEKYQARWQTLMQPGVPLRQDQLLAADGAETTRMYGWGNGSTTPPQDAGLLVGRPMQVTFMMNGTAGSFDANTDALFDGKEDSPAKPWLKWGDISWLGEGSAFNWLQLDTFRTTLRVTGITLLEDAAHPESWIRDAYFEYWDTVKERWVFVQPLLANAAVHYHRFEKPVEAARFRIVLQPGLVGNLRLGEIRLYGEDLGGSHPDVQAKRPLAVLFDEQTDDLSAFQYGDNGVSFNFGDAFSGEKSMQVAGGKLVWAQFRPPFGHVIPNWDFHIAENPQPGQYRYLQFAWKAASADTRGMAIEFGGFWIVSGQNPPVIPDYQTKVKYNEIPPKEWQLVQVDLWTLFAGKPPKIFTMGIAAYGGGVSFDNILLARRLEDFPALP